jgi:hypothetical protein
MQPIKMKCDNCPSKSRHLKTVRFGDGAARQKMNLCPECVLALRRFYKDQQILREFLNSEALWHGNSSAMPTTPGAQTR